MKVHWIYHILAGCLSHRLPRARAIPPCFFISLAGLLGSLPNDAPFIARPRLVDAASLRGILVKAFEGRTSLFTADLIFVISWRCAAVHLPPSGRAPHLSNRGLHLTAGYQDEGINRGGKSNQTTDAANETPLWVRQASMEETG